MTDFNVVNASVQELQRSIMYHTSIGLTIASLKQKSRICRVLWRQTSASEPFELAAGYPLELLSAFSSHCRDLVDESALKRPKMVLVGANFNAIRLALRWILAGCDGDFHVPNIGHQFLILHSCKLVETCRLLELPEDLAQIARRKVLTLTNVMPAVEDVKAVFDDVNFPNTHIARSIAAHAVQSNR
jgi:hypothetical protein